MYEREHEQLEIALSTAYNDGYEKACRDHNVSERGDEWVDGFRAGLEVERRHQRYLNEPHHTPRRHVIDLMKSDRI